MLSVYAQTSVYTKDWGTGVQAPGTHLGTCLFVSVPSACGTIGFPTSRASLLPSFFFEQMQDTNPLISALCLYVLLRDMGDDCLQVSGCLLFSGQAR